MALNLSGRSFLTLLDFTTEEIEYMLELSRDFKNLKRMGAPHRYLEGKNIVLLFEKTSTRTRCAFEVGGMFSRPPLFSQKCFPHPSAGALFVADGQKGVH